MALTYKFTIVLDIQDRETWYRELRNCSRLVEDSNGWTWDLNFFRSYNAFAS